MLAERPFLSDQTWRVRLTRHDRKPVLAIGLRIDGAALFSFYLHSHQMVFLTIGDEAQGCAGVNFVQLRWDRQDRRPAAFAHNG